LRPQSSTFYSHLPQRGFLWHRLRPFLDLATNCSRNFRVRARSPCSGTIFSLGRFLLLAFPRLFSFQRYRLLKSSARFISSSFFFSFSRDQRITIRLSPGSNSFYLFWRTFFTFYLISFTSWLAAIFAAVLFTSGECLARP